jgi:hypothetical protein
MRPYLAGKAAEDGKRRGEDRRRWERTWQCPRSNLRAADGESLTKRSKLLFCKGLRASAMLGERGQVERACPESRQHTIVSPPIAHGKRLILMFLNQHAEP